jgi:hypothetical protein
VKRLSALAALLLTTLFLAACGGGQAGQGPESGEGPTEPATEESAPQEAAGEGAPAERTTPEDERDGQDEGSGGYSVTTLDGEEVSLGASGEVTALFFMAGW